MKTPRFITPTELSTRLPDALVVDCAQKPAYRRFHIPGAHHSPCRYWKEQGADEGLLAIDDVERFAELVSQWGIRSDRPMVGYDNSGGLNAARLGWTFERFGLDHFQILDGGIESWYAAGLPLSQDLPKASLSDFRFRDVNWGNCAKLLDVEALAGQSHHVLWDDRSDMEWAQGRIPGAVHLEWTELLATDKTLLPLAALREQLKSVGVTPDKAVTVYCLGGIRAAHSYWVLKHLEYPDVRVYDGSWAEYAESGSLLET